MIRSLTLLIGLSAFHILYAQTYQGSFNINEEDSGGITSASLHTDGSLYTASVSRRTLTSSTMPSGSHYGTIAIRKLSSSGTEEWKYEIAQSIGSVMHLKILENGTILASGTFADSLIIEGLAPYYANEFQSNAFLLCLNGDGSLLWHYVPATYDFQGNYYKVFDVYENKIYIPHLHYIGFARSTRVQVFNLDGDSLDDIEICNNSLIISEFEFDDAGNVYLGGTGGGNPLLGGVELQPDTQFSYLAFIAKLDPDFKHLWSRKYNYITFDFYPKLAVNRNRVAFLVDSMPQQNGIGNHHLLKIFDLQGNDLSSDSVGPTFFSRMHKLLDVQALDRGFVYSTLKGFQTLSIVYMDEAFNYTELAYADFQLGPSYAGFVHNDSTLMYLHCFYDAQAVVNGSDSLYNGKNMGTWSTYQQFGIRFDYENSTLRVDPVHAASVQLYPNPAQLEVNILVPASQVGQHFEVYDLRGGIVLDGRLELRTQLDIASLLDGMYVLRTADWSKRFVKL